MFNTAHGQFLGQSSEVDDSSLSPSDGMTRKPAIMYKYTCYSQYIVWQFKRRLIMLFCMPERRLRSKIGNEIRRLRHDANMSQEDLAGESGLHTNHISLIERGLVNLTVEAADKITCALNLKLSHFFERIGE